MKTSTLAIAAATSLAIWGGGAAIAQSVSSQAPVAGDATSSVIKADARKRGGRRGARGAMMRILRAADANKDNALTQAELDAYVDAQAKAADADGNGEITLAEFETVWKDFTRQRMTRAFQRLDRDASGAITAEERAETFGNVVSRMDRNDDGKLDRADRRGRKGRRGNRD